MTNTTRVLVGAATAGVLLLLWQRRASAAALDAPAAPGDDVNDQPPTVGAGVRDLAQAIAHAEGFGVAGAIPTRANNPGDLVIPGWTGGSLGAESISVFANAGDGWAALYAQLQRIIDGRSSVYTLDDTFGEFADHWTGTDVSAWTSNVLGYLVTMGYGVTIDTPIAAVLLA
jgi:hypothetical protein